MFGDLPELVMENIENKENTEIKIPTTVDKVTSELKYELNTLSDNIDELGKTINKSFLGLDKNKVKKQFIKSKVKNSGKSEEDSEEAATIIVKEEKTEKDSERLFKILGPYANYLSDVFIDQVINEKCNRITMLYTQITSCANTLFKAMGVNITINTSVEASIRASVTSLTSPQGPITDTGIFSKTIGNNFINVGKNSNVTVLSCAINLGNCLLEIAGEIAYLGLEDMIEDIKEMIKLVNNLIVGLKNVASLLP